jgi:hypothetical protein
MKNYKNLKKIKKLMNFDLKNMWKSVENHKSVSIYLLIVIEMKMNKK